MPNEAIPEWALEMAGNLPVHINDDLELECIARALVAAERRGLERARAKIAAHASLHARLAKIRNDQGRKDLADHHAIVAKVCHNRSAAIRKLMEGGDGI